MNVDGPVTYVWRVHPDNTWDIWGSNDNISFNLWEDIQEYPGGRPLWDEVLMKNKHWPLYKEITKEEAFIEIL